MLFHIKVIKIVSLLFNFANKMILITQLTLEDRSKPALLLTTWAILSAMKTK